MLADSESQLLTLFVPLQSPPGQQTAIALHDSLTQALLPWRQLNRTLGYIFAGALAASLLAAVVLGQSLSAPIRKLTDSVKSIAAGQYQSRVPVRSTDEVGQLCEAFNEMAQGLQEREKVRSLLGKVVSEEIAQELLHSDLELGGEERQLTVLFCDVRNFTSLCEGEAPSQNLGMLNQYFSGASEIVERNGGVVDKYMGDAIMALFGAPVATQDHAERAMRALLQLRDYAHSRELGGDADFSVGLGMATGLGVVGNMGSENRLNYTVIGDSVNLAARLESLTRMYRVDSLVSQATCEASPGVRFRQIDRVQVKGKTRVENIYQPLDESFSDKLLVPHQQGLELYFAANWQQAQQLFEQLRQALPADRYYPLMLQRCDKLLADPPPDWDGIQRFQSK